MTFKWNSFLSTIKNNGNWVFVKKSLTKLDWTDYNAAWSRKRTKSWPFLHRLFRHQLKNSINKNLPKGRIKVIVHFEQNVRSRPPFVVGTHLVVKRLAYKYQMTTRWHNLCMMDVCFESPKMFLLLIQNVLLFTTTQLAISKISITLIWENAKDMSII